MDRIQGEQLCAAGDGEEEIRSNGIVFRAQRGGVRGVEQGRVYETLMRQRRWRGANRADQAFFFDAGRVVFALRLNPGKTRRGTLIQ